LNKLRKYITPLILVFALFAINGAEFLHHHDAGNFKDDKCQACLFNKTLNTTLVEDSITKLSIEVSYEPYLLKETNLTHQDFSFSSGGRSPPSVSHI
jgi:hypothetical protein